MNGKNINTIPYGKLAIIYLCSLIILSLFLMFFIPKVIIELAFLSLILFIIMLLSFKLNYWNTITINAEGVQYKNYKISWNELRITMFFIQSRNVGRGYYFAFSDKFLTKEDIKHIRKTGFYILVNYKRLSELLNLYTKKIEIIDEAGYCKNIYIKVKNHNSKVSE